MEYLHNNFMIKIAYNKRIDAAIISDAEKQFQLLGIKTESREQKDGVSNAIWWALPPLIAIWIAKPFLDGFLNELGKDSAGRFKKILRELYSKLHNSPIRACNRGDLEKISNGANPMLVGHALPVLGISLQIEDIVKRRWGIRCILPAELSENEIQKAIEQMQNYLPSIVELERQYLADLKENQIILGSRSYIYDLQQGWISEDKILRQEHK
jgi:hypothetical protein